MQITKEFIEAEIKSLTRQEHEHIVLAQQCAGAKVAYQTMLKRMDAPEPEKKPDAKKEPKK